MKRKNLATLLSEVLESQVEKGQHGTITPLRLHEACTVGPPLDDAERRILLLSPLARFNYKSTRDLIRKELHERLEAERIQLELLPLAASSNEDKVLLKGMDFNVTLFNKEDFGIPWIILVQLGTSYMRTINPMTTLRLVDTGGLEWMRGRPDENGELTATWQDEDTDLLKRVRRFSLLLEPV